MGVAVCVHVRACVCVCARVWAKQDLDSILERQRSSLGFHLSISNEKGNTIWLGEQT